MKSIQETFAPNNSCFGCGPANPKGLMIKSFYENGRYFAIWRAREEHEAFPNVLNGGIIGSLLDCHSNWAAAHHLMLRDQLETPPCTVTADFHVFLRRPTPTRNKEIGIVAEVIESKDARVKVKASIEVEGKVTAECEGHFVAVTPGHPAYHRW
jgi:acyl-coenzyme A thioesterase PaaI-like protein